MNLTELATPYAAGRHELRKLTPLLELADAASAKTPKVGLGYDLAIGGLGGAGALANPWALAPAAGVIGTRRLLNTPGGGRMLYEAGRAADADATRQIGRQSLNLARSSIFSPNGDR